MKEEKVKIIITITLMGFTVFTVNDSLGPTALTSSKLYIYEKKTHFSFNIRGEAVAPSSGSNRPCFYWAGTNWTVSCMLFWSLPQLTSPRCWGTPTGLHGSLTPPTPNWLLFLFGFLQGAELGCGTGGGHCGAQACSRKVIYCRAGKDKVVTAL